MSGKCMICGADMKDFDVIDKESGEKVAEETCCPNEWKESHDRGRT